MEDDSIFPDGIEEHQQQKSSLLSGNLANTLFQKSILLSNKIQQSLNQCEVLGLEKGRTNQNRTDRNSIHVVRRSKSKIDSS